MTTTEITPIGDAFAVTVEGHAIALVPTRMLATILAETLANDQPEGTDFDAWADHYVTEIWPDEVTRLHGYVEESFMRDACATDVEPCHYVYAAIGLGLLDLPTRWDSGPWHPNGLHLYSPHQGEIVITNWDDADEYTVGCYAAHDHDHEGGDIVGVRCDDLIDHLNGLFAMLPPLSIVQQVEAAGGYTNAWPMTDPLPHPLTTEYFGAVVRTAP